MQKAVHTIPGSSLPDWESGFEGVEPNVSYVSKFHFGDFQVIGVTFDGALVNRRLLKEHDPHGTDVLYTKFGIPMMRSAPRILSKL